MLWIITSIKFDILPYFSLVQDFSTQSRLLTTLYEKLLENIVGRKNAGNHYFLLFPQCFLPFLRQIYIFESQFILWSANAFNLDLVV